MNVFEICVFLRVRVVSQVGLWYSYCMRKRALSILILLSIIFAFGLQGCKTQEEVPENPGNEVAEPGISVPEEPPIPELPYYTRETIGGIDTVYFGSTYQTAEDEVFSVTLRNLISDGIVTVTANGTVEYAGTEYLVFDADESVSGKSFGDGREIVPGERYFFAKEAVAWRVIAEDDESLTLLAIKALDVCAYRLDDTFNSTSGFLSDGKTYANDYAASYIREYINGEFLGSIFGGSELAHIKETVVDMSASGSAYDGATDKEALRDKAYLLSYRELCNDTTGLIPAPNYTYAVEITDYAVATGANARKIGTESANYIAWWLRSEGNKKAFATCVPYTGVIEVKEELYRTVIMQEGVRPVIRIEKAD